MCILKRVLCGMYFIVLFIGNEGVLFATFMYSCMNVIFTCSFGHFMLYLSFNVLQESQSQNSPSWSFGTPFSHVSHGSSDGGLRTSASAADEDTATSEGSSSDSEDREQRVRCSPS